MIYTCDTKHGGISLLWIHRLLHYRPLPVSYGDEPEAWQAWYDDTDWQEVTLPHDWSVTLPLTGNCSSWNGLSARRHRLVQTSYKT